LHRVLEKFSAQANFKLFVSILHTLEVLQSISTWVTKRLKITWTWNFNYFILSTNKNVQNSVQWTSLCFIQRPSHPRRRLQSFFVSFTGSTCRMLQHRANSSSQ